MLQPTHVRHHVNFMRQRGFSADQVLAGSGIDGERLSDRTYFVTAQQCHLVVKNMLRMTGDPGIGVHSGGAIGLNELGIIGYAMASSSTLGQAVNMWLQYGNSPVGLPFSLRPMSNPRSGSWGVDAVANGITGSIYRFYVEENLAMGVNFLKLVTSEPIELLDAAFSFPKPHHEQLYRELLRCPMTFDAPSTYAIVKSPRSDSPVKDNNDELRELCISHCSQMVRNISKYGPTSARLRAMMTTSGTIPTLDSAAEAMNQGTRTLRRHLQAEGSSFQKVLDEFRADLAQEYLRVGVMPAKEVAYRLGFGDVESLRRAFKIWTGKTIGEFVLAGRARVEPTNRPDLPDM